MPTIRLQALDTLFFKDGKPFSMGDDSFAEGVFPPSPSGIYGALRSAYISQNLEEKSLEELIEESENLEITGIYFYNSKEGHPLRFPMPLDYVKRKSNKSDVEVLLLKLISSKDHYLSSSFPYINIIENNEHVEAIKDGIFEPNQMETYLDGDSLTNNTIDTWEKLLVDEPKYGNSRNNETRSTGDEGGALYRVGLKRLNNIELVVSYQGLAIDLNILKLGAEGKTVTIENYKGSIDLEPAEFSEKHFKIVLLTSALFKNGSTPNLEVTINNEKVKLELINAVVGKSMNIGGWDIANKRPKSMLKAVPAGSVYYYRILSNHTVEELYNSIKNHYSISDFRQKEGFGLYAVANLKIEENLIQKIKMTIIKVITTVGTSLFTNYMREEVSEYLKEITDDRGISTPYSSLEKEKGNSRDKKNIKKCIIPHWIIDIEQYRKDGEIKFKKGNGLNEHCCAEVQTLVNMAKDTKYKNKILEVYLLATDTQISQLAAEIIEKEIFNKDSSLHPNIKVVSNQKVDDLNITDAKTFEEKGFFNLIDKVKKIKGDDVVLNISGGYKALIPPLTIVAQLDQIPIYYNYEEGNKLIEIGNLPINFDWQKAEIYHYYLQSNILQSLPIDNDIYKRLVKLKLIHAVSKAKTVLGNLFLKYIDNMPDSKNIFGYIFELKLFEYFAQNQNIISKTNTIFYIKNSDKEIVKVIPDEEKGKRLYIKVEMDLLFKEENKWVIIECKSYKKLKPSLIKSIENSIYVTTEKIGTPKKVMLAIHKYPFQDMKRKKSVMQQLKNECSLPIEVRYVDVPIDLSKADINYMNFMQEETLKLVPFEF